MRAPEGEEGDIALSGYLKSPYERVTVHRGTGSFTVAQFLVSRLTPRLGIRWQKDDITTKRPNSAHPFEARANSILETRDGGIAAVGYSQEVPGIVHGVTPRISFDGRDKRALIVKLDPLGNFPDSERQ